MFSIICLSPVVSVFGGRCGMIGYGGTTVLNIQLHVEEVNDWMALFLYPLYYLSLFSNQRHSTNI